jgi:hypothetical protein
LRRLAARRFHIDRKIKDSSNMASDEPLHVSFDGDVGPISAIWNVDFSTPGEVRLAGNSAMMEWATGPEAGHGYGTYTIDAKLEGNEPGPAILFWPGNDEWPGQELDLAEITPDGSGRQYGTVHWNANGSDGWNAQVYDGVQGGVFHEYQMVWEPGRITYNVDGVEKAVFTENVPIDFAHGGVNNTIGFLNNNSNTSVTVRDVTYVPLGEAAPAEPAAPAEEIWVPQASAAAAEEIWAPQASPAPEAPAEEDTFARWTNADGHVDWNAVAEHVIANYEATGYWFV